MSLSPALLIDENGLFALVPALTVTWSRAAGMENCLTPDARVY
jgi:hypothetical protein